MNILFGCENKKKKNLVSVSKVIKESFIDLIIIGREFAKEGHKKIEESYRNTHLYTQVEKFPFFFLYLNGKQNH